MPLLASWRRRHPVPPSTGSAQFLPACANPYCASGRLHLWRSRRLPMFEGGWVCSLVCTRQRIQAAVHRELAGSADPAVEHQHRVPLGLILLAQGWIDRAQLRRALEAQRKGDASRIGEWLVDHCSLDEQRVAQALSLQWNCPVYSGDPDPSLLALSPVPRIFVDALAVLPLRLVASGPLYVAFEDRIDHSLTLGIERITGRRVESGFLKGSEFHRHHAHMLAGDFLRTRLIEAVNPAALVEALARLIEKAQPAEARLVRVHRFLWLRMWKEAASFGVEGEFLGAREAEDVIASIA